MSSLPDFELFDNGSAVGVLEVTRWADPVFRSTVGSLKKKPVHLPGSQHNWHAQLTPGLDLKALRQALPRHASDLENRSVDVVSGLHVDPTWSHLQALGIQLIRRGAPSPDARLHPTVVAPGGSTSREILADIVESEVSNNLAKLQYGSGPERHLWVWLEYDGPEGADVMVMSMVDQLPGSTPRCRWWLIRAYRDRPPTSFGSGR